MQFNVTFDSTVSATAQAAINNVMGVFGNTFSDNVTVNIEFQFSNIGGLGLSNTILFTGSYAQIKSATIRAYMRKLARRAGQLALAGSLPRDVPAAGR